MPTAIVTGAASGIGRAIIERLASDGWAVIGVDRDQDQLDALVANLQQSGAPAAAVVGDTAVRETHRRAREAALTFGDLDVWVGAAGLTRTHELTRLVEADARALVDVNQLGLLWGAAEAVDAMVSTGTRGTVVAISSVHAQHAFPHHAVYEMTKAASEALVRNIAVTYGPQGIRAVGVAPGAVDTPAMSASLAGAPDPAGALRHLEQQTPAGRIAQPAEIAATVAFLVSPEASYISGVTLTVDGGWSAVLAPTPEHADAVRPREGAQE